MSRCPGTPCVSAGFSTFFSTTYLKISRLGFGCWDEGQDWDSCVWAWRAASRNTSPCSWQTNQNYQDCFNSFQKNKSYNIITGLHKSHWKVDQSPIWWSHPPKWDLQVKNKSAQVIIEDPIAVGGSWLPSFFEVNTWPPTWCCNPRDMHFFFLFSWLGRALKFFNI